MVFYPYSYLDDLPTLSSFNFSQMMHPHYFSIIFFLTFIFNTQTSLCTDDIRYINCSLPVYCGDQSIEINYPFWGVNRPDYCGQPGFQIECQEGVPKINMMSNTFRILHINSTTQTLKVARDDFWSSICPAFLFNTTLDFTRFNYAPGQRNLTLYYGCALRSDPGRGSYIVYPDCAVNDTSMDVFYAPQSAPVDPLIVRCNSSVIVPVLETAAQELDQRRNTINVTLDEGFELQWNLGSDQCSTCVNSGGFCGYNSTKSLFVCFCRDQPNAIECSCSPGPPADEGKKKTTPPKADGGKKKALVIGVAVAVCVVAISLVCCCIFIVLRRRKNVAQYKSRDLQTLTSGTSATSTTMSYSKSISSHLYSKSDLEKGSTYFGAQIFRYAELEEATENFDSSKELGDGGFGTVYYGVLKDGRSVAVKRLYENTVRRVEQFKNEIEILTRLRHPNLVALYGCTSRHSRELLLVYEYISNGTVADHLHGSRSNSGLLTWPIRLNIAIETAEALAFLHVSDVIHRDVKTNNILLDNNFHVKVADFGLSRFFPNDVTHVSTAPQGTPGYVDPEYYQCYQLTEKSDVYSFGVVLIELISSLEAVDTNRHRHDINLANMAISRIQNHALKELVDPSLGFEKDYTIRNMITSVAELAFRCLQQDRDLRPAMQEILEVLREIQSQQFGAQKAEVVDFCSTDDVVLLRKVPPPLSSPDSGGNDKWMKIRTL
ncbi:LEAF RUST 10 DISEASE-RESISTANCE LOCUS RECEPTOR-LIKE PROTEIN KINASE-like 1.3 isoform X2 [Pistacia vera]|uniref:LEAF RUST 10 DISEASE-RESISTANCE LOCUS RECEPTOR-LIKE PROTEIN KINASE-like 1.3 isoform X2 n=1 Tax=Pistacia vera TaxID=55513 RepID=UPI0012636B8A|nr:LEAF RUST 10 DISEASE-RESISTANCE LOCUS RECEPTOR-LIKE PROTEIN KINASE-like 1.3 isoform X2 [Pistacia vera]